MVTSRILALLDEATHQYCFTTGVNSGQQYQIVAAADCGAPLTTLMVCPAHGP